MNAGVLGIIAAQFESPQDIARVMGLHATKRSKEFPGWQEWTAPSFEIRSDSPIEIGIDGEATTIDPPLQFRIMASSLRVRIPHQAPGYSPAAARLRANQSTIQRLVDVLFRTRRPGVLNERSTGSDGPNGRK